MSTAFTALLALITGLVGALFGHLLAERKSRRDELAKMRLDAYSDFIRAISHLSAARRTGHTQDELKELVMQNDAKVRICICSDSPVVEAMERFWLQGGTLEQEQEILAFTHLCRTMRASLGNKHLGLNILLSDVMFKLEPSTYSFRGTREID
ncbi:hypothetical protein D3C78_44600 [compost metagenome]